MIQFRKQYTQGKIPIIKIISILIHILISIFKHNILISIFNTPPQAGVKIFNKRNLSMEDWSKVGPIDFVNISTNYWEGETKDGRTKPVQTFSRMKCMWTSICLVCSWNTRSEDNIMTYLYHKIKRNKQSPQNLTLPE